MFQETLILGTFVIFTGFSIACIVAIQERGPLSRTRFRRTFGFRPHPVTYEGFNKVVKVLVERAEAALLRPKKAQSFWHACRLAQVFCFIRQLPISVEAGCEESSYQMPMPEFFFGRSEERKPWTALTTICVVAAGGFYFGVVGFLFSFSTPPIFWPSLWLASTSAIVGLIAEGIENRLEKRRQRAEC